MVNLKINGKEVKVQEGSSIIKAAEQLGVSIPSLCYFEGLNDIGACRICVVEVLGQDRLVASCATPVEEGMEVLTDSPRARRARMVNMQLLLSQHNCSCPTCSRSGNCKLQELAAAMNIDDIYRKRLNEKPWNKNLPIIRDATKCIHCLRCIQVCDNIQGLHIWKLTGTGGKTGIEVREGLELSESGCVFCGQCVTRCPTSALGGRDDTEKVFEALENPEVTTIVQVAPSVRAAWGEMFGMEREMASPMKMAAAMRRLGFDYVFDTNFTADLTIMEEGSEFVERFTHREDYSWPMFTSCCPGWVRFLKGFYPEFTENLSTAKSPQQMFGAVAKSFFAEKIGKDPKKLFCVSIMPCTAKKAEREIPTMNDACGDSDVDVVITTREFDRMLRAKGINPELLPEEEFDSPLGSGTGAAVVFGATGGVMDAALRSAYYLVTGENPDPDAFKAVRGPKGRKEASFNIPGAGEVRLAVVSGLKNTRELLNDINRGVSNYDFVEVMACPGGCVGGGGQPIKDGCELAVERGEELWRLDRESEIRYSHENPDVIGLYEEYFGKPLSERSHHLLHTDHSKWEVEVK